MANIEAIRKGEIKEVKNISKRQPLIWKNKRKEKPENIQGKKKETENIIYNNKEQPNYGKINWESGRESNFMKMKEREAKEMKESRR